MAFPAGCIPGIDVSHFNGSFNWASAATAGEQFAYMKASESGTVIDAFFVDNWRNSKAAGLLRGAYHFFHPDVDANAQVDNFLNRLTLANGSNTLNPGDLPAALDIEISGGVSPQALVAAAATWLAAVEAATGRTPIVYTCASFWMQNAMHVPAFIRYPLWVAEYGPPTPKIPATWPNWTIWQFAVQTPAWVSKPLDMDAFQGDMDSLLALAGIVPPAVDSPTPPADN